jgi:hypothetical protein
MPHPVIWDRDWHSRRGKNVSTLTIEIYQLSRARRDWSVLVLAHHRIPVFPVDREGLVAQA